MIPHTVRRKPAAPSNWHIFVAWFCIIDLSLKVLPNWTGAYFCINRITTEGPFWIRWKWKIQNIQNYFNQICSHLLNDKKIHLHSFSPFKQYHSQCPNEIPWSSYLDMLRRYFIYKLLILYRNRFMKALKSIKVTLYDFYFKYSEFNRQWWFSKWLWQKPVSILLIGIRWISRIYRNGYEVKIYQ